MTILSIITSESRVAIIDYFWIVNPIFVQIVKMRGAIFFTFILLFFSPLLYSQSTGLNTSFGKNGKSLVNIKEVDNEAFAGLSVMLDINNNVLVGGKVKNEFAVQRMDSNGRDDKNFGYGGYQFYDFGSLDVQNNSLYNMLRYPDGRILMIGNASPSKSQYYQYTSNQGLVVMRVHADGRPDSSFGVKGKGFYSLQALALYGCSAAVQADGKIIVSFRAAWYEQFYNPDRSYLIRLNGDGSVDNSFGDQGVVKIPQESYTMTSDPGTGPGNRMPIALLEDGKFLVGSLIKSFSLNGGTTSGNYSAIFRYNANGSLDSSFGTNGRLFNLLGFNNYDIRSIVIQPDHKILVAGSATFSGQQKGWMIFRLFANGTPDSSFANNAVYIKTSTSWQNAGVGDIVLSNNGDITGAAFHEYDFRESTINFFRMTASGVIDSSFAHSGNYGSHFLDCRRVYDARISMAPDSSLVFLASGWEELPWRQSHVVVRTDKNGLHHSNFSGSGWRKFLTALAHNGNHYTFGSTDRLSGMAVSQGGNIMLAGNILNEDKNNAFLALSRLKANGSPDSSFGVNGKMQLYQQESNVYTRLLYRLSDNKLILTKKDEGIIRIDSAGQIDSAAFGINGVASLNQPGIIDFPSTIIDVTEQSDHKILVLLPKQLIRFNADGTVDPSFASGGVLTLNAPFNATGVKVKIQSDGMILVATNIPTNAARTYILRCDMAGIPDNTFGTEGGYAFARVPIDGSIESFFNEYVKDFVVLPDGTIIIMVLKDRSTGNNAANYRDIILYKLKSNGVMDYNFGKIPNAINYFGTSHLQLPFTEEYPGSISLSRDGRIVISGYFNNGKGWDIGLVFVKDNGSYDFSCGATAFSLAGQDNIIQWRRGNVYLNGGYNHYLSHVELDDGSYLLGATQQGQNADFAVFNLNSPCVPKPLVESIQSGAWNSPSTWSCNCVPSYSDNVTIKNGHSITVTEAMGIIYSRKLTVETGGTINLETNAKFKQIK